MSNPTDQKAHAMKCAHTECLCVISSEEGVQREGRLYCSDACASGNGCGHQLCPCSGK